MSLAAKEFGDVSSSAKSQIRRRFRPLTCAGFPIDKRIEDDVVLPWFAQQRGQPLLERFKRNSDRHPHVIVRGGETRPGQPSVDQTGCPVGVARLGLASGAT